ncbi:MAG: prolyl oligopeptidase family serine peptidase [Novosphingobium sp.]|uniref:S9 family peptidase n=1 Tax=Novosphingobium sp. TaxID=1874826 RepID=UPI0027365A36|nr:prolyl oligopeptidase family serine peptidase [Novosphingobium sp.]MDP3551151.1 prolyl oligopeptidase family serine peptidase [Novosphingobium sp.]
MLMGASATARPLSIDDVLATATVDRADISPDSEEIAIAMPRPVTSGEVYGRNSYEIDSSRTDIWLVKRDGSQLRQLTDGQASAAGYWCPYWSPDGKRLAMLSTAPELSEPRGGDNVRLYVWERGTKAPRRVSDRAMMTQVRYGSPLNELDLRSPGASLPNTCRENDENAPFVWLGPDRLLAVLMPSGERSTMVDRYAKFHREASQAGEEMRAGEVPTLSRSDSATAAAELAEVNYSAELVIFNLADGSTTNLGEVPAFPMFGALTIALSPNARRAAILAPVRAIPPHRRSADMPNVMAWAVENALFMLDLGERPALQRVEPPGGAQFPLDIIGWSPESEYISLRARAASDANSASLWTLAANALALTAQAPGLTFDDAAPAHWREGSHALWADRTSILVRDGKAGSGWRLVDVRTGRAAKVEDNVEGLASLRTSARGQITGQSKAGPVRFDPAARRFVPWKARKATGCDGAARLVTERKDGAATYSLWSSDDPRPASIRLASSARMLNHDCSGIVWAENGFKGSVVNFTSWDDPAAPRALMQHNQHLADIAWGERRMIDYRHADGTALKMAVLLPADYDPARRYPTLMWVYGGYSPSGIDDYFLDPHMPGLYNLELYASHGYVVAIPSIPVPRSDAPGEPLAAFPGGVLPAIDKLVELGITDNDRVGVFGQSFGGYTVSALVAQTDRFRAAAAIAGATDIATNYGAFDPAARGWPGIEQDMAANGPIYESGLGFRIDPATDPALYHRNSPLTFADRIHTPLLLIHGELDTRAPLSQPEALYSLLRRKGRTARLLRYWGENHSLANSPANIRDITRELVDWFDLHLKHSGYAEVPLGITD